MMKTNILFIFLLSAICTSLFSETISKEGKISEVTLYRTQALVTRTIEVDIPKGEHEVVVTKLPPEILINSLFAESTDTEIRAVRLNTKELAEEPNEPLREINEKLDSITNEITRLQTFKRVNQEKLAYLKKQEDFVSTTEKIELSRGLLKANTSGRRRTFSKP